jgi:hypothetical protein
MAMKDVGDPHSVLDAHPAIIPAGCLCPCWMGATVGELPVGHASPAVRRVE